MVDHYYSHDRAQGAQPYTCLGIDWLTQRKVESGLLFFMFIINGPNPLRAQPGYSIHLLQRRRRLQARRTAEDVRFVTHNGLRRFLGYSNSELPICETE